MSLDKDYENAIRYYLDTIFTEKAEVFENSNDIIELNVVKPMTRYITANASVNFKFSTPMFAWWDLTSACNFRCVHCLYNDTEYDSSNDLTDEEALNLAETLTDDFGIVQIVLSGGEVFLRAELLKKLILKFKENNVGVTLASNASLISPEYIDFLAKNLNMYTGRIQISLDGATSDTFKKIRGTDGFYKIVETIKSLAEKGVRVTVVCIVNNINYDEVVDVYDLCESLGVYDFVAGKMLCYNDTHKRLCVSDREKMLLAHKLLNKRANKKTLLKLGLFSNIELLNVVEIENIIKEEKYRNFYQNFGTLYQRSCNLNDRISIRSDGNVYMCMEAACPSALMGNIREKPLGEIWAERGSNVFFQPRVLEKMGCKDCRYSCICNGGCMAKAYKRFGTINSPELACRFCKRVV